MIQYKTKYNDNITGMGLFKSKWEVHKIFLLAFIVSHFIFEVFIKKIIKADYQNEKVLAII